MEDSLLLGILGLLMVEQFNIKSMYVSISVSINVSINVSGKVRAKDSPLLSPSSQSLLSEVLPWVVRHCSFILLQGSSYSQC
jgi:hypothetical protein